MSRLFDNNFNGDISSWNTSSAVDFNQMFHQVNFWNGDISGWDTSRVTTAIHMFDHARAFNGDLSRWNMGSLTNARFMFESAHSFNSDLSEWDTSRITDMSQMFDNARAFSSDLSRWNTSKATDMERMFRNAGSFNSDLLWNTSSVTNMDSIFENAVSFNGNIAGWDTSRVTECEQMFRRAESFNADISTWDTGNCLSMEGMFDGALTFNGDLSRWNVTSCTNLGKTFKDAEKFNSNLSGWDVSSVYWMQDMFFNARAFNGDISNWDTRSLEDSEYMFQGAVVFNGDLSKWDTSLLEFAGRMFLGAKAFNSDISRWDARNLQSLRKTFEGASSFNVDISGWNIDRLPSDGLYRTFFNASSFNQNLCAWNSTVASFEMDETFDLSPKLSLCDVNECLGSEPCGDDAVCVNTDGSFECQQQATPQPTTGTPDPEAEPVSPMPVRNNTSCGPVLANARACNLWVRNHLQLGTGDIEGRLCVGGSLTVYEGTSIGSGLPRSPECSEGAYSLVVGGDVRWDHGRKYAGSHCIGGSVAPSISLDSPMNHPNCPGDREEDGQECRDVIDFASDHQALQQTSDSLFFAPPGLHASSAKAEAGLILITLDASRPQHVVEVDAALFEGWDQYGIRIEAEHGTLDDIHLVVLNLINVGSDGLVIAKWFDYPEDFAHRVLFNYPGTRPIAIGGGSKVLGSILAPRAALASTSVGTVKGQVVVDSYLSTISRSTGIELSYLNAPLVCLPDEAPRFFDPVEPGAIASIASEESHRNAAQSAEAQRAGFSLAHLTVALAAMAAVLCVALVVAIRRQRQASSVNEAPEKSNGDVQTLFVNLHGEQASKDAMTLSHFLNGEADLKSGLTYGLTSAGPPVKTDCDDMA